MVQAEQEAVVRGEKPEVVLERIREHIPAWKEADVKID